MIQKQLWLMVHTLQTILKEISSKKLAPWFRTALTLDQDRGAVELVIDRSLTIPELRLSSTQVASDGKD